MGRALLIHYHGVNVAWMSKIRLNGVHGIYRFMLTRCNDSRWHESNYVSNKFVVSTWKDEMYVGCLRYEIKSIRIFLCWPRLDCVGAYYYCVL